MNDVFEILPKVFLGIACAGYFAAALFGKSRLARAAFWGAWLCNAGAFALNCVAARAPAFGNMFHVMTFLPLTLPCFGRFLRRGRGGDAELFRVFALVAAFASLGACFMGADADWRRMPALQSVWFVPHVFAYLVAYALFAVATVFAASARKDAASARMERAEDAVRLGFAFLTFGLCSGALWADAVWGGFWSWDIKEAWALITWGVYLLYLHLAPQTRRGGAGRAMLAVGFLALLVTFFVVNGWPKLASLHSYAA